MKRLECAIELVTKYSINSLLNFPPACVNVFRQGKSLWKNFSFFRISYVYGTPANDVAFSFAANSQKVFSIYDALVSNNVAPATK